MYWEVARVADVSMRQVLQRGAAGSMQQAPAQLRPCVCGIQATGMKGDWVAGVCCVRKGSVIKGWPLHPQ